MKHYDFFYVVVCACVNSNNTEQDGNNIGESKKKIKTEAFRKLARIV